MKKLIFAILATALVFLTSCSKEEVPTKTPSATLEMALTMTVSNNYVVGDQTFIPWESSGNNHRLIISGENLTNTSLFVEHSQYMVPTKYKDLFYKSGKVLDSIRIDDSTIYAQRTRYTDIFPLGEMPEKASRITVGNKSMYRVTGAYLIKDSKRFEVTLK